MTRSRKPTRFRAALEVWLLAASLSIAAAGIAAADDNQPAAGSAPAVGAQAPGAAAAPAGGTFPAQPPAVDKPGFLHQLGVWWNDGFADFGAKVKNAQQKLDDFNKQQSDAAKDATTATGDALKNAAQATKDAATAVVKLPISRVLELRDRCNVAANGAPDCQTAATDACRTKGFTTGQPVDVRTSQECPAAVILSGRTPNDSECHDETVVLRAVCQ
jgi:hypothetical protein